MNRKRRIFDDFWNLNMNDMFKSFNEEFFSSFNELKSETETEFKEGGPITFGYSMRVGPETDYVPEVRQWGNLNDYREKQGLPQIDVFSSSKNQPQITTKTSSTDRFVDFIDEDESLKIIVEVPGFTKENLDIEINESGSTLTLKGNVDAREINQVIQLPSKIEPNETKSTIRNGVLEIEGKKQKSSEKRHKLRID